MARRSDFGAIAALSRREVEHGLPWVWTPEKLRRFASLASTNAYVAVEDKNDGSEARIVGFSIASLGDARAHLVLLAVDRQWRKCGLGRELLEWQIRAGLTAGLADMSLEVRANNKTAQRFYTAAGFRKLRVLPRYYSGLEDAVRYRLSPLSAHVCAGAQVSSDVSGHISGQLSADARAQAASSPKKSLLRDE